MEGRLESQNTRRAAMANKGETLWFLEFLVRSRRRGRRVRQGGRDGRPAGLLPDTPHRFLIGAHSGQQLLLPGNYQPTPRDTHKGLKIRVELTVGEN